MDSSPITASRPSTPALVAITFIICATVYLVVYRIYPGPKNQEVLLDKVGLKEKKNVLMPDRVQTDLLGTAGSTVMGFFYLNQGDKTLRRGLADVYTPLLQIENNWALEVTPSPKEKEGVSARLRVQTQHGGTFKEEIIDLPSFPKQRWTHLAILREGRRFDVLYDSRIVASQRLEHYPVVIASPLSVGGKGLDGTAIHLTVNSRRLSPEEVERERKTHVDTNGMVTTMKWELPSSLLPEDLDTSWTSSFTSWNPFASLRAECPAGIPCDTVTKPPSNTLYGWRSPYA